MSTIKVNKIENTATADGGIAIDASGHVQIDGQQLPTVGALSNRNLVINGAMQVSQRATQVTGSTGGGYLTCDRMYFLLSGLGTWTVDQSTDAPAGFSNSFKLTCTTANASPAAGAYCAATTRIEAQNLQHLNYGSSDAVPLTISFYVKSNKTGAATFELYQDDPSTDRIFSQSYTINSANTWEYKTITFAGDASGLFNNDNGIGFYVNFWMNSGSNFTGGSAVTTWIDLDSSRRNTSNLGVGGAVSDYFAITGVQLEVGEKATPFEHRSFGDELARCERYFELMSGNVNVVTGVSATTAAASVSIRFRTLKRAAPGAVTLAAAGQSSGQLSFLTPTGSYPSTTGTNTVEAITTDGFRVTGLSYAGLTAGGPTVLFLTDPGTFAKVDAEL